MVVRHVSKPCVGKAGQNTRFRAVASRRPLGTHSDSFWGLLWAITAHLHLLLSVFHSSTSHHRVSLGPAGPHGVEFRTRFINYRVQVSTMSAEVRRHDENLGTRLRILLVRPSHTNTPIALDLGLRVPLEVC